MKTAQKSELLFPAAGFTLVEILVAVTILVTLIGGVFLTLNPISQINKTQDAKRQADIQAIKVALDLYYNDTKCYPKEGTIPFGAKWSVGNTVYMSKVPEDPICNNGQGTCYKYRTVSDPSDPSYACPQWNVVFAQLTKPSTQTNACALSSLSNCTPEGYSSSWACTMSGAVDCSGLLASSIEGGSDFTPVSPTSSLSPTSNPISPTSIPATPTVAVTTPTPTLSPNGVSFPLTQGGTPDVYNVTLDPLWPYPGQEQKISVSVSDSTSKITDVHVVVTSDGNPPSQSLPIVLHAPVGDPNNNGVWTYTRIVGLTETYNKTYALEFFAKDAAGVTNSTVNAQLPLRELGK